MGFEWLRCIGAQTHLKCKFGDGFNITMLVDRLDRHLRPLLDSIIM
jgi:hypothetical protein